MNDCMPFIVGVGRSGTTFLRLMIDAHSSVAIPPEANWLEDVLDVLSAQPFNCIEFTEKLLRSPSWPDFKIDRARLDAFARSSGTPGDLLRAIYKCYADTHNKATYGDKTPKNILRMAVIQRHLPEARFVHIIRDGRDVALSWRGVWFGRHLGITAVAEMWRAQIRLAKAEAPNIKHYLEIKYEDLCTDPESVIRQVDSFLSLTYEPMQLIAYRTAAERLSEFGDIAHPQGIITAAERKAMFELVLQKPTTERIGRWRREMSKTDVIAFESIAGDVLDELGYFQA